MKRILISTLLLAVLLPAAMNARLKQKTIDNGGSGAYKAEAREEKTFKDAVIYKPVDMKAAASVEGKLPVLVWANGGCNDTSLPHERMLNEVASRGYIVIALGSMQERIDDRQLKKSPNEQMLQAMDWIAKQAVSKRSAYFGCVDPGRIAVAGQSCGGAQALVASSDPRVMTTVMVNSGMGDMEMSGASRESLSKLHAPVLYMPGGESDIAYGNAVKDYARINHVFAAFANHLTAGHVGDFEQPYGGSFARMLTAWLDWQLKGRAAARDVFMKNRLDDFPEWTMQSKDPKRGFLNEPFSVMEVHCTNQKGQDIFGRLYLPNDGQAKKPLTILAHGYNSSYRETEAYAQSLAMNGIAAYIFDFCGGAVKSRSQGKSIEMSVFTESDDVAAVVATARKWGFVDPARIALLGCSQGGLVAAIASSQMPDAFKAVVLVYPALMIAEHAVNVHPKEAITSKTGVDVMGMPLSHVYYDKLVGYKVFDEMKKYRGDVMIVYGDKDPIAAGDYMDRARKAYQSCEVNVVPGGAHGFPASATHVQANDHIVKFLKGKLLDGKTEQDFVKGADVGFLTGQERHGVKFHDRNGQERECLEMLKNDYQMSAIRMRVWVNPRGGSCDKNELLAMARRVKALGMDLMVDFHYADSWADPAKQPIPAAWKEHSYQQMLEDVRLHTVDVLTLLKENGITPRWVQVGNETANGMLWPVGHIEKNPAQYAGFIGKGYDAVKEVFPEAIVIVHLDRGHKQSLYDWNLDIIRNNGGKWDMIGMSLYPYWAMDGHPEVKADDIITDCIANIRHVSQKYGCDVMIVETGYEVDEKRPEVMQEGCRQLTRVIREARTQTNGRCRGVFYWEPQCMPGGYKLGAFDRNAAPTVIMDGFIE